MTLAQTLHAVFCALLGAGLALCAQAQNTANAPTETASTPAVSAAPTEPAKAALPAIVLLLPAKTTPFAQAAEAVRAGFLSAHDIAGKPVDVQIAEIEENPAQLVAALEAARKRGVQLVVGPLTRTLANALTERGALAASILPMVTLNIPDDEPLLPPSVVAMSLSVELEARRVVRGSLRDVLPLPSRNAGNGGNTGLLTPRVMVIAGPGALDRRIAAAYRAALADANEPTELLDMTIDASGLSTLRSKLAALNTDQMQAAYLALDARAAALVRPLLPRGLQVFGTSQVLAGEIGAAPFAVELDGLRFTDVPWLLEPDHSAVMVYPRPQQPLTNDLQRLYALGIDAYRVAMERLQGRAQFTLDGVTGQLQVDRRRSAIVERVPTFAVFRNGKVEALGPHLGGTAP
jgi:uncharacterized protein